MSRADQQTSLVQNTGLHEYYSSFANIGHNDFISLLILWVIPNGAWLVVPGYMIYVLSKEIVEAMDLSASGGNAKR